VIGTAKDRMGAKRANDPIQDGLEEVVGYEEGAPFL
jgi:hypothetical protein